MAEPAKKLKLDLDAPHRQMLELVASRSQVSEDDAALELLNQAIETAAMSPRQLTDLVDSIPGAWERAQRGHEQIQAGNSIPLSELR